VTYVEVRLHFTDPKTQMSQ